MRPNVGVSKTGWTFHLISYLFGSGLILASRAQVLIGSEISYEWVVTFWEMGSNTLITTDVTFNIYRDALLIASDIDNTSYIDSNPSPGMTHCYIVKGYDGAYESNPSNESCSSIDPLAEPIYFVSQLNQTGENQLVIIENLIGDDANYNADKIVEIFKGKDNNF